MIVNGRKILGTLVTLQLLSLSHGGCSRSSSGDDDVASSKEPQGVNDGAEGLSVTMDSVSELIKIEDVPTCKGGDVQLYADLAYPKPVENKLRPALIFIHGGSWTAGSRKDFSQFIAYAAKRGYVAATIQYRLTEPVFPNEIFDVKCAVRWMRAESNRYGVDPNQIGAFGASAGGHLALMLGTTAGDASLEGDGGFGEYSSAVQTVVNWFGPADLAALYRTLDADGKNGFDRNLGGSPESKPEVYARFSPLNMVNKASAPTITVHGDADPLVPYAQGLALKARFEEVAAPHELVTVVGGGHGFPEAKTIEALDSSFEYLERVLPLPQD